MSERPDTVGWALVTGGSRGIGRAIVLELARAGYAVEFTWHSNAAAAAETELLAGEAAVCGHACDGADADAVATLARRLLEEKGAPRILVSNAGVTSDALISSMSTDQWRRVVSANLDGAFHVVNAFAEAMMTGGGAIVLISSVSGMKGIAGQANYAATKAGLSGMARVLAVELGRFGIRVNAVAPGFVATDMLGAIPDGQVKSMTRGIPLRRVGTVDDIAPLVSFLASERAAYITGQTIVVDGGLTA
jgi:3-oxoacyl-[acyl-carrier protein] reductase